MVHELRNVVVGRVFIHYRFALFEDELSCSVHIRLLPHIVVKVPTIQCLHFRLQHMVVLIIVGYHAVLVLL